MTTILTYITYCLSFALAPTLVLLIIPIPLFLKKKILQILKYIVHNKYISITLLTLSILLFIDSFIQLRKYETQKDEIPIDAPMASRITIYSQLFRSQRNTYLTFFNLLLVFVIWRVGKFVNTLISK